MVVLMSLQPPAESRAGDRDPVRVHLTRDEDGVFYLTGGFTLPVPFPAAWGTLTDYNRIEEFVDTLEASWIESRGLDSAMVRQEGVLSFLFFKKRVGLLLSVQETPHQEVRFEDVSGEDFEVYVGAWELIPDGEKVHVLYRLAAKPRFATPPFLTGRLVQSNVAALLRSVREEMLRRSPEVVPPGNQGAPGEHGEEPEGPRTA
jgi:hypothetical protein